MKSDESRMVPIMTNSESLIQFGNNAYAKTATALNILRETVMGRELFDYAFKTYAERWAFKHPTPADFFRTMEDASAVDLDWFWRGWFYTIDNVDIAITNVEWYKANTMDPAIDNPLEKAYDTRVNYDIAEKREGDAPASLVETRPELRDFYDTTDAYGFDIIDKERYEQFMSTLTDAEKALMDTNLNYYHIELELIGGLVMPVILEFEMEDGSKELVRIPAEIWRKKGTTAHKIFFFDQKVVRVSLDPYLETADINRNNNHWPAYMQPSRFDVYKSSRSGRYSRGGGENPMQKAARAAKKAQGE
jgi:hypothetical protein